MHVGNAIFAGFLASLLMTECCKSRITIFNAFEYFIINLNTIEYGKYMIWSMQSTLQVVM